MNAAAKTLFTALIAVAGAAAIGTSMADHLTVTDAQPVHKLERVVVVGKRMVEAQHAQIVQLPRVVIEGHSNSYQVASVAQCKAAVC